MGKEGCAVEKALDAIGGKWNTLVIRDLLSGRKRFTELQDSLGVSSKVLTSTLKHLDKNKVILRNVEPTTPPSVYYELSEYGFKLKSVIESLELWGSIEPPTVSPNS